MMLLILHFFFKYHSLPPSVHDLLQELKSLRISKRKQVAGCLKDIFIKANKYCIISYDFNRKKATCLTLRNELIIEIFATVVWGERVG